MAQQPDVGPWPPLSSLSTEAWFQVSRLLYFFTVRGRQPLVQPPTWRTRVSLLVWIIPFDLSGMGDPTSSYATAGIALRVI
jgi:ABC-type transport system involved in cytochrome c biogenesis permease subunit